MADAAQQFTPESEMDSEFRKAADLARDRAIDSHKKLVSITQVTREMVANDNGVGGVAEHTRPTFSSPSGGGSFEDDMAAPSASPQQGAIEHASPAFVPQAAAGPQSKAQSVEATPDEMLQDTPPETLTDGTPANSSGYNDQFNQAPEASNVPLISEEGAPVGMSAAYEGDNYQGPETGGIPGGSSPAGTAATANAGENEAAQLGRSPQSVGANTNANNDGGAGGVNPQSQRQLQNLENQIKKKNEEIRDAQKAIEKYTKKEIDPLRKKLRKANWVDAKRFVKWYCAVAPEFWWPTIIGVIIDVLLTIPLIIPFGFIILATGALSGPESGWAKKRLEAEKRELKPLEKNKKMLERELQQLRQQQFQLIQVFSEEAQQEQGGQRRPQSGPPNVGGIPLAT